MIAMGLCKLPRMRDYWQKGIFGMAWFRSIVSRTRFFQIQKYLHVSDNTKCPPRGQPGYKLYKIQPVINVLVGTFQKYYTPGQSLSVDEQMIGTKCRVSFLQYMPKKPKRFGIKLWAICEAATGYCCNCEIYTGKEDGTKEHGLAYRVVTNLVKPFVGNWHVVYFDNFFSSVQLVSDLLKQQVLSCGTIRKNRVGLPTGFGTEKLKKGEQKFWTRQALCLCHLISSR